MKVIYRKGKKVIIYIIFFVIALSCIFPFYVMIISATHSTQELRTSIALTFGTQLVNNYNRLTLYFDVWKGMINSFIISAIYSVLVVLSSTYCGYVFSKSKSKLTTKAYIFVLVLLFIPTNLAIIGFYRLIDTIGLLDSYAPLIIPNIVEASMLIFSKQYCDNTIKNSIVDAALVDGASTLRIFISIIIPDLYPMMVCLGTLSFIDKWNEFLIPSVIIFSQNKRTMPIIIASLRLFVEVDYGAKYTAIMLATIPILIIFFVSARRITGVYNEDPNL